MSGGCSSSLCSEVIESLVGRFLGLGSRCSFPYSDASWDHLRSHLFLVWVLPVLWCHSRSGFPTLQVSGVPLFGVAYHIPSGFGASCVVPTSTLNNTASNHTWWIARGYDSYNRVTFCWDTQRWAVGVLWGIRHIVVAFTVPKTCIEMLCDTFMKSIHSVWFESHMCTICKFVCMPVLTAKCWQFHPKIYFVKKGRKRSWKVLELIRSQLWIRLKVVINLHICYALLTHK